MRVLTATEASRNFSDLLDAVEAGESVTITRGNRAVAEIRAARRRTGRDLRVALEGVAPFDADIERDIASALEHVSDDWADPWRDA